MDQIAQRVVSLKDVWNADEAKKLEWTVRKRLQRDVHNFLLSTYLKDIAKLKESNRWKQIVNTWKNKVANIQNRLQQGQYVVDEATNEGKKLRRSARQCKPYGYHLALDACYSDLQDVINRCQNKKEAVSWQKCNSAFKNRLCDVIISNCGYTDPRQFFEAAKKLFIKEVGKIMKRLKTALKIVGLLYSDFVKDEKSQVVHLWTKTMEIYSSDSLSQMWEKISQQLWDQLSNFELGESGLALEQIRYLKLNINSFNPIRGGGFIPTPKHLQNSGSILNIKNNDKFCFLWSVLSALHPSNSTKVETYKPYMKTLKWRNKDFPMQHKNVRLFEKKNNLNIWVYGLDDEKKLYPLYKSQTGNYNQPIDLLYLQNSKHGHYCLIKDIHKLLHAQGHRPKGRQHLCRQCLHFRPEKTFEIHLRDCQMLNKQAKPMMPEEEVIKFKNYRFKELAPVVCYADFESILVKDKDVVRHEMMAAGLYVHYQDFVCTPNYYLSRVSSDAHVWLVQELEKVARALDLHYKEFMFRAVPILSKEERKDMYRRKCCHICEEIFRSGEKRVCDHSHWTGKYRGPAHNECNQNYKDTKIIPVLFHNFSHYDAHYIVKALISLNKTKDVQVIANNEETLIFCTISFPNCNFKIRFMDSFRFMPESLSALSNNLQPSMKRHLRAFFRRDQDFNLVSRKGIYPYEYMDSLGRLVETELPPREAFYSSLYEEDVSKEDYQHAKQVWENFKISNLEEYTLLYLKTDVLLLSDIFENFRLECLKTYQLDPAHYVTSPSLTYDAALKYTKVKLDRLMDLDIYLFIEKSIRGGMVQTVQRYAAAEPGSSSIVYLDVTNLYGWAMSQSLPYSSFSWLPKEEWWRMGKEGPSVGYFLEIDLEYPLELHDAHSDYPLAPTSEDKLMLTLRKKNNYVLHHRNLALYLQLGLRATKVHRVLRFVEIPWLRDYVNLNARKRAESENDFEKNFYKLMVNSLFGKTIENPRKRQVIHLVTSWERAAKWIAKSNFHHSTPVGSGAMIKMLKTKVILDKPIYVGTTVLDLSKTFMFDFHYNFVKCHFPTANLLYTDTDSLIYLLPVPSVDDLIARDPGRFDTSQYPPDHPLHSKVNAKRIGSMKDEVDGKRITEFIGLRPKLYAYQVEEKDTTTSTKKRAKGVRKAALRKITFEDYKKSLFNDEVKEVSQQLFESDAHVIRTKTQIKLGLSANDDKRYCEGKYKIKTLPWGHYRIQDGVEDHGCPSMDVPSREHDLVRHDHNYYRKVRVPRL